MGWLQDFVCFFFHRNRATVSLGNRFGNDIMITGGGFHQNNLQCQNYREKLKGRRADSQCL